jgi:hypothetical protein
MFGKRGDAAIVTGLDGITRLMPLFAITRSEATDYCMLEIEADPLDAFIEKKRAEGIDYTYMDITIAILVRLFRMRPRLNQFIMGGRIWQRNSIVLSMIVRKSFRPNAEETSINTNFTGYETLAEVKKLIDSDINTALHAQNDTDNNRDVLAHLPLWLMRLAVGLIKFADYHGLCPAVLLKGSPFHASFFVSNLKSISLQAIHHHLFNFGNCGFFLAMGKESYMPKVNPGTGAIENVKIIKMGISVDERCVDGLYFSHMLKTAKRIFADLPILERPLREDEIQQIKAVKTPKQRKLEAKAEQ